MIVGIITLVVFALIGGYFWYRSTQGKQYKKGQLPQSGTSVIKNSGAKLSIVWNTYETLPNGFPEDTSPGEFDIETFEKTLLKNGDGSYSWFAKMIVWRKENPVSAIIKRAVLYSKGEKEGKTKLYEYYPSHGMPTAPTKGWYLSPDGATTGTAISVRMPTTDIENKEFILEIKEITI